MLLGIPDENSLPTLRELALEHGWLKPSVDQLLLTPWMLARLFVPDNDPGHVIPPEWQSQARIGRDYQVIGPPFEIPLLTGKQRAHLNYSVAIGPYLLHPLILSMLNFSTPEDAFTAWNRVIETRNRNMEIMQKQSPLQEEITRREFFSGIFKQ